MNTRWFSLPVLSLLSLLVLAPCPEAAAGGKKKGLPNILYIMSDDHASAAIGCYGSWLKDVVKTPNLNKLAAKGMRFTNCAVTNSICTPSRAAILTGQYSHKNGVYTLNDAMSVDTVHLAHLLQAQGYQTAVVGKWHLATDPQGFDYWNILPGQGKYYDPVMYSNDDPKKKVTQKGYSEDVITDISLKWLKKRDKNKPFFLMCHYKAPHRPWDPAPRFKDMYKDVKIPEPETLLDDYKTLSKAAKNATLRIGESMVPGDLGLKMFPEGLKDTKLRQWAYQLYMKRYLGCVAAVDENVGRLLEFLEEENLADDTIVVYTSDQGFFLGEHGWFDKRFMYEPCVTTPLIMRYPGHIPAGKVNQDMAMNIDFAPTLLEYAGKKAPKEMQGKSIKPLLEEKTPKDWRTSMYYRYYMHLAQHGVPAHYGIRTNQYSLIYYYGDPLGTKGSVNKPTEPEWELFDRKKDPNQTKNVVNDPAYAETVNGLKAELNKLKKEVGDPQ
jgi:arylsulfatase A-like enzyme